jgi:hypothetical protein
MFQVANNLSTLQACLSSMMGRHITMDQLRQDVGLMVEKITHVTLMFRKMCLRMEEYVCLKVITMLNQGEFGAPGVSRCIIIRWFSCFRRENGLRRAGDDSGEVHELLKMLRRALLPPAARAIPRAAH